MLNRTNQTLSALALSNRLNLGTRSFAVKASAKLGAKTLRTRHVDFHQDLMRVGMEWSMPAYSIPKSKRQSPSIPSFFPGLQSDQSGSVQSQRVVPLPVVDVVVRCRPRPASLVDRCDLDTDTVDSRLTASEVTTSGRAATARPGIRPRLSTKSPGNLGTRLAAWRATSDSAAMSALWGK
jgi:hypothetical protein